jgi:hypothetical protein
MPCEVELLSVDFFKMAAVAMEKTHKYINRENQSKTGKL